MSSKPVFKVDLTAGAASSLDAHYALALSTASTNPAVMREMRAPLGVYNISVGRVCQKVARLCANLEKLFRVPEPFGHSVELKEALEVAIDYMELAVYAAAEHVDDVNAIASAYFLNENLRSRDAHFRAFDKDVKHHKRFLANLANSIKHEHSRLRIATVEFWHDKRQVFFYGYFIEGAENGVLGPRGRFHAEQDIFSVTALAWEIIGFVLAVSRSLAELVRQVARVQEGPHNCTSDALSRAVIAAARLPLYTFGEPHLFNKISCSLGWTERPVESFTSGLYGAFEDRWSQNPDYSVGGLSSNFEGDGSSRSFRLIQPKQISIHHWGAPRLPNLSGPPVT